jgi:hypothetical protein
MRSEMWVALTGLWADLSSDYPLVFESIPLRMTRLVWVSQIE